jgi:predicted transport protein
MSNMESVAAARKKVAGAYKDWLMETYETQLSEMGSKKTRHQLPAIDPSGAWADVGIQSKPLAWIVEFWKDGNGSWVASLPHSNYPHRLGGSFNSRSPLQGVLSRILPVVRVSDTPRQTEPHPYWEWAMALVFPGRPVFQATGSSGGVIEFDPSSGRLWSPVEGTEINQAYVESGLFKLVPDAERWSGSIDLTYAEATEALAGLVHVNNSLPPEEQNDVADEDDNDAGFADELNPHRASRMEYRLSKADDALRDLLSAVDERLHSCGSDVRQVQRLQYYAYERPRRFALLEVYPTKHAVMLFLKIDPRRVTIEPGFTRDMTATWHFGGIDDLEVTIKSKADLERASALIDLAYGSAA